MERSQKRFFGGVLIGLGVILFLVGGFKEELVALVTIGAAVIVWGVVLRIRNRKPRGQGGEKPEDSNSGIEN